MCLNTLPKSKRNKGRRLPFDMREAVLRRETLKSVMNLKVELGKINTQEIKQWAFILWEGGYSTDPMENWNEAQRQLKYKKYQKAVQLLRERDCINKVSSEIPIKVKHMISMVYL